MEEEFEMSLKEIVESVNEVDEEESEQWVEDWKIVCRKFDTRLVRMIFRKRKE